MSHALLRAPVVMRRGAVADKTAQGSVICEIPLYSSTVHSLINIRSNNTQEGEAKREKRKQSKQHIFSGGRKLACNEILPRTCHHTLRLLMRALLFLITSYLFYTRPFEQLRDIEPSLIIASF